MAATHHLIINDEPLPIIIRKHKSARRMVIRYQPLRHEIRLTLPRYVSIRQGLRFVDAKRKWIAGEVATHHKKIPLADGAVIPVLGAEYRLHHTGGRGLVRLSHDPLTLQNESVGDERLLLVPGDETFIARRVRDGLKRFAAGILQKLAQEKAVELGVNIKKISLRDTSSLWGSCSQDGRLSFSWRLVFAPYEVLEYVVCHEVAHMKELNHSPAFWQLVERLCPDWRRHRRWLAEQGATLYRYG